MAHDAPAPPPTSFLQEHWDLTDATIGAAFGGPFGRRVFVIDTEQGTFAVKVNDSPPPVEAATAELAVLDYLAARGYRHAPALLRTRSGASLVHTGTRSVVVLEFIPGRFDQPDSPQVRAWEALARATAVLNAYTDYPHQSGQAFVDQVPHELRQKVRGHELEPPFLELLKRVAPLQQASQRSLVHGEVNFANSGYRPDGTAVLLDWDGAGTGPTALDYGYPLITQFIDENDRTFHQDAAEAFYGAYTDAGGAVDVEMAFLAAVFQALFLMWFFNSEGRWERIQWAVEREAQLCSVIENACARS
jgi:Ser/Thr protein kinase RdoA (MazF antagonist)